MRQLQQQDLTFLLFHGRESTPGAMAGIATKLARMTDAVLIPQAENGSWYPLSVHSPIQQNEPVLTQSLDRVESIIRMLEGQMVSRDRIVLTGFSQGACLVAQFLTRYPARYAAALVFSGCVLGADEAEGTAKVGSLYRTPVLLSASRYDPFIPWPRVERTACLLDALGAETTLLSYAGASHTITHDDIEAAVKVLPIGCSRSSTQD